MFVSAKNVPCKGKSIKSGKWVIGSQHWVGDLAYIIAGEKEFHEVIPESIGLYVCEDENKNPMFTGDMLVNRTEDGDYISVLVLFDGEAEESYPYFGYTSVAEIVADEEDKVDWTEYGFEAGVEICSSRVIGHILDNSDLVKYVSNDLRVAFPSIKFKD